MPLSKSEFRRRVFVAVLAALALLAADRHRANNRKVDTASGRSAEAAGGGAAGFAAPPAQRGETAPMRPVERAAAEKTRAVPARGEERERLDRTLFDALQITAPDLRRRALRSLAEMLAEAGDVVTAGDYVAALLGPDDRTGHGDAYTFTKVFADRLAERDPAAVIAWSAVLPDVLREVAYPFVARHSVERDLKALTEWTRSIENPMLRATVLRATGQELRRFGADDRGTEWARALAASPDGARFSDLVVEHLGRRDFAAAAEWAAKLSDAQDRETAFLTLASTAGEHAPAAALSWASSLPQGELRARVVGESLAGWALTDPAAAANWCDAHAGETTVVARVLPQIASSWLQRDRDAAARWIARTPMSRETKAYLLGVSATRPAANR